MRARRLQEVYCRFEIRRTLRAAKDERHLLRFFNDCSSLSVPETPSHYFSRYRGRTTARVNIGGNRFKTAKNANNKTVDSNK